VAVVRGGGLPRGLGFNEAKEVSSVYNPLQGQSRTPKTGIGRAQIERYWERYNASRDAAKFNYKGNVSVKAYVDKLVSSGYRIGETGKRGAVRTLSLTNKRTGESIPFGRAVETNYIKTVFGIGNFARNY
jgi:hypothetical protein